MDHIDYISVQKQKRFVRTFVASERFHADFSINQYALKNNLIIVSTSLFINQGEFYTMVVFERKTQEKE